MTVRLVAHAATGSAFSPTGDVVAFSGPRSACAGHAAIRSYHDECGPGRDTVRADRVDVVRGCEIVHRS